VATKAALALLNVERENGKVHARDDLLAALRTEGAVALMSRAVADVDVLQALLISDLSGALQRLNGRRGQAGQPVGGEEAGEMEGDLTLRVSRIHWHMRRISSMSSLRVVTTRFTISRWTPLWWICCKVRRTGSSWEELTS
jgi:hypothetical protein